MGNGTVSASKMLNVVKDTFDKTSYEVYIASSYLDKEDMGNIHIAPRWNFDELLKESFLFINHGGQNSIADGLIYGVPQIIIPGKIFERKYNAQSVEDAGAGIVIKDGDWNKEILSKAVDRIIASENMRENAKILGNKLLSVGGIGVIKNEVKKYECK